MAFQDGFGDPRVRDESGSLTNEIYNFEPYTTIHVIFTAYVNSERLTDPFYGESLRKTITSNVEGAHEPPSHSFINPYSGCVISDF